MHTYIQTYMHVCVHSVYVCEYVSVVGQIYTHTFLFDLFVGMSLNRSGSIHIIYITCMHTGEFILLNLFVGMILDNFGFITDEVAQMEDPEWNTGSSSKQIDILAQIFSRFSNRENLMAVSKLDELLRAMPIPLG